MIWARAWSNANFPTLKMPKNAKKKAKCDGPTDRQTDRPTRWLIGRVSATKIINKEMQKPKIESPARGNPDKKKIKKLSSQRTYLATVKLTFSNAQNHHNKLPVSALAILSLVKTS